jgi:hypothetical protein
VVSRYADTVQRRAVARQRAAHQSSACLLVCALVSAALVFGCGITAVSPSIPTGDPSRPLLAPPFDAGSVVMGTARGVGITVAPIVLSGTADAASMALVGASCSGGGGMIVATTGDPLSDPDGW